MKPLKNNDLASKSFSELNELLESLYRKRFQIRLVAASKGARNKPMEYGKIRRDIACVNTFLSKKHVSEAADNG